MGDFEDVEAIAENLEMNEREKARYELHKEDIKRYAIKANFWAFWNITWQIIFFWGLVVIAIDAGQRYANDYVPTLNLFFGGMSYITAPMAIVIGILGPFSFFVMIYTGIVRSKWEGKLTRATAYALSFLSNIEHREFMVLEEKKRVNLRARAIEEKTHVQDAKKIIEVNQEISKKKADLLKACKDGKITRETYEYNIKMIDSQKKK
ncbi:MAG: hypothetical protein KAR56_01315 [Thermoplasmata archaeon]|nr:hypothetical protein [Thermoplasmata archaeon]